MEIDTEGVYNDKLNIQVNNKNEITQYAIVGGVGGGGIFVPYEIVPDDFRGKYEKKYYLYKDGVFSVNPDYEPARDTVNKD